MSGYQRIISSRSMSRPAFLSSRDIIFPHVRRPVVKCLVSEKMICWKRFTGFMDDAIEGGNKEQILQILPMYLGVGWVITNFVIFAFVSPEISDDMTVRIGVTIVIAILLLIINMVCYNYISQNIGTTYRK